MTIILYIYIYIYIYIIKNRGILYTHICTYIAKLIKSSIVNPAPLVCLYNTLLCLVVCKGGNKRENYALHYVIAMRCTVA